MQLFHCYPPLIIQLLLQRTMYRKGRNTIIYFTNADHFVCVCVCRIILLSVSSQNLDDAPQGRGEGGRPLPSIVGFSNYSRDSSGSLPAPSVVGAWASHLNMDPRFGNWLKIAQLKASWQVYHSIWMEVRSVVVLDLSFVGIFFVNMINIAWIPFSPRLENCISHPWRTNCCQRGAMPFPALSLV